MANLPDVGSYDWQERNYLAECVAIASVLFSVEPHQIVISWQIDKPGSHVVRASAGGVSFGFANGKNECEAQYNLLRSLYSRAEKQAALLREALVYVDRQLVREVIDNAE